MKIFYLTILIALASLLFSCSNKGDGVQPAKGPVAGTVTINGTVYPTVTIGNQVWTTQNYSGPGGSETDTNTGDATLNGNYYSTPDITLPTGWRVPTRADFNALLSNFSNLINPSGDVQCDLKTTESLLSKTGWENITGTNLTGFNAYSAGYATVIVPGNPAISQKTDEAFYLTSTLQSPGMPPLSSDTYYILEMGNGATTFNNLQYYTYMTYQAQNPFDSNYYSVRFVKDK